MNRRNKALTFLCVILAAAALTVFAAMAGGGAGSQSDPLVTLSYLTGAYTDRIMDELDALLAQRNAALQKTLEQSSGSSEGAYAAVTLSAGQALRGEAGCEILLRSGSARCGDLLIDATSGGSLSAGAQLETNHLYLMPGGQDVSAADGAALLVRGNYSVI